MPASFQPVFERLRGLLHVHAGSYSVTHDTSGRYALEAPAGPSTVRAWGGKLKTASIPVAWVELRANYVSYHLMGVGGNTKLTEGLSRPLRARMQGKTCFNFTTVDEGLFDELQRVTTESLRAMKRAGFIADANDSTQVRASAAG